MNNYFMKKLLLLLLLIPLMSFGQITLEDIFSIKDVQTFQRVMIENGFTEAEETEDESVRRVTIQYNKQAGDRILMSAIYRIKDTTKMFDVEMVGFLYPEDVFGRNESYNKVYDVVKSDCEFYEVREYFGNNVAFYSCPNENPTAELLELDEYLKKELPEMTASILDYEIGFVRSESLYIIHFPITDKTNSKAIELVKSLISLKDSIN